MPGNIVRRIALSALCSAAGLAGAGCGGQSWKASTFPAQGTVTINGKPATGAFITLHSVGKAVDKRESRPWAMVDETGAYTLRTYSPKDGAPAGEYQVSLVWRFDPYSQNPADKLASAYSAPEKNPWTFTIAEGENQLPPIELKDVKVLDRPARRPTTPPPLATE